jgi:hypothetical protein
MKTLILSLLLIGTTWGQDANRVQWNNTIIDFNKEYLTIALVNIYDIYAKECYNDSTEGWQKEYTTKGTLGGGIVDYVEYKKTWVHNNIPNGLDAKFIDWLRARMKK